MSRETGNYHCRVRSIHFDNPDDAWSIQFYNHDENAWRSDGEWISEEDMLNSFEIHPVRVNPVPADDWISTKDSLPGMGTPILAIDIYKRNYQFPVSIYRTADPVSVFRWYDANDDSRFLWQVTHWKCIATETRVVEE